MKIPNWGKLVSPVNLLSLLLLLLLRQYIWLIVEIVPSSAVGWLRRLASWSSRWTEETTPCRRRIPWHTKVLSIRMTFRRRVFPHQYGMNETSAMLLSVTLMLPQMLSWVQGRRADGPFGDQRASPPAARRMLSATATAVKSLLLQDERWAASVIACSVRLRLVAGGGGG